MANPKTAPADTIRPEPRWPAFLGLLGVAGILLSLPESLTLGPNWLIPGILIVLIAGSAAAYQASAHVSTVVIGYLLSSLITLALMWSLAALILGLPSHREPAIVLLRSAGSLWISNILVFASWYWRLDAGGPHERDRRGHHSEGAFLFPQMTNPEVTAGKPWRPGFVDYLFLAFNTSTAFSPTDSAPLTRWAKGLMMVQSCISLGTLTLVAARAVNIL